MIEHYQPKIDPQVGAQMYAQLRRQLVEAGILDRDYLYYAILIPMEIFGLIISTIFLYLSYSLLGFIFYTFWVAFFSVRLGGLIHDLAHRGVFKSNWANDAVGYLTSAFIGFPYRVWKKKHNMHHANPNVEDEDPDLEVPISFTAPMFDRKGLIISIMKRYQAVLFFIVGPMVSITMRVKSYKYYRQNFKPIWVIEIGVLTLGLVFWFIVPFFTFGFKMGLLFELLYIPISGFYMLNIFAPNHKGMPQIQKFSKISFIEKQAVTSRNLRTGLIGDYLYMGLNFQVEHHLFPSCPRRNLSKSDPLVKKFCLEHGIPYLEMTPVKSSIFVLSKLNEATKNWRAGT